MLLLSGSFSVHLNVACKVDSQCGCIGEIVCKVRSRQILMLICTEFACDG